MRGQVMLLSVLLIGSSILVFSAIAGYLMTQRIRLASNTVDSTKAIFVAEAGLECELYNFNFNNTGAPRSENCGALSFYGGDVRAIASTSISVVGSSTIVRSIGLFNNSRRALLFVFDSP